MKLAVRCLCLLVVLRASLAHAQIQGLQNIFVIMQENRTPDNLFQDQTLRNRLADIQLIATGGKCGATPVPLQPRTLADCANPVTLVYRLGRIHMTTA